MRHYCSTLPALLCDYCKGMRADTFLPHDDHTVGQLTVYCLRVSLSLRSTHSWQSLSSRSTHFAPLSPPVHTRDRYIRQVLSKAVKDKQHFSSRIESPVCLLYCSPLSPIFPSFIHNTSTHAPSTLHFHYNRRFLRAQLHRNLHTQSLYQPYHHFTFFCSTL